MKTYDVIVAGVGIIGLSLALELRRRGLKVLALDRAEPGQESSHAGAGMLAAQEVDSPASLRELAWASARLYPSFVRRLESDSGLSIDFRRHGTLCLVERDEPRPKWKHLSPLTSDELHKLEPAVTTSFRNSFFLEEDSVDPRSLFPALLQSARKLGVEVKGFSPVSGLIMENGCVRGVRAGQSSFSSGAVVNCCGAWAAQLPGVPLPTRPLKGHMLSVVPVVPNLIHHVVRSHLVRSHAVQFSDVYLVPRNDGRILIGSTVEEAGFDKSVDAQTIQQLHQFAAGLVSELKDARIHEAWTGLRPGTPDDLPILGQSSLMNYFVATGHYRNGILLAPITAQIMADVITGNTSLHDISAFSPQRFS